MAHYVLVVNEADTAPKDTVTNIVLQHYKHYKVLNPLRKNGQDLKPGDTVKLEEKTGQRFVAAGDVEELDEDSE